MESENRKSSYIKSKVNNLLSSVTEEGNYAYVVTLTSEQFKQLGFYMDNKEEEERFYKSFRYVDVYLLRNEGEINIVFLLDSSLIKGYYVYEHDLKKSLSTVLEEIVRIGGTKMYLAGSNRSISCDLYQKWVEHKPHVLGTYVSKNYGELFTFCEGWGKSRLIVWSKQGDDTLPDQYFFIVYD